MSEKTDKHADKKHEPNPAATDQTEAGAETSGAAEQIARLQAEKDELTQTLVRRQADYENYRKRVERERQEEHQRGIGHVLKELMPVLDAFDRALQSYAGPQFDEFRKGLELIYRQLWDALARQGVERIAAEGKMFDPHFHQAIERVETSELPDGAVADVVQDGFSYHGRVLRPSVVRVAAHVEKHSAAER